MIAPPKTPEIDHRTIKLLVGLIAFFLPILTDWFALPDKITSVSAAYFAGDWPRSIFTGFLFAIAAFLAAYNGRTRPEMFAAKAAAVAAFLIAMYPCACDGRTNEIIAGVHYVAAAVMFVVLAFFCWKFFLRAVDKARRDPQLRMQAHTRAAIYAICGAIIVVSIGTLALNLVVEMSVPGDRFIFWYEAAALMAFGVSWFTASHIFPWINAPQERFSPMRADNPAS